MGLTVGNGGGGRSLDDISKAIQDSKTDRGTDPAPLISAEELATQALRVFLDSLSAYSDEQVGTAYELLVGEIVTRGLEEEIMGEVADPASISLDEEMNSIIKLVRSMRNNLAKKAAGGKEVSNREVRETLAACVTAMKTLTSHQKAIRTLERSRVLEHTLIEVLGELNADAQQAFQERFRERLEELSDG